MGSNRFTMLDESANDFQSLYEQWQSAMGSVKLAELRVASALIAYRQCANESAMALLQSAVRARHRARVRIRELTSRVWAAAI